MVSSEGGPGAVDGQRAASRNGAKSFLPVTAATFLNDEGGEQDLEAVLLLALDFPPGASAQRCCILLRAPLSREAARQRLCWLAGRQAWEWRISIYPSVKQPAFSQVCRNLLVELSTERSENPRTAEVGREL